MTKPEIKKHLAKISQLLQEIQWSKKLLTPSEIAKECQKKSPEAYRLLQELSRDELRRKGFISALIAFGNTMKE